MRLWQLLLLQDKLAGQEIKAAKTTSQAVHPDVRPGAWKDPVCGQACLAQDAKASARMESRACLQKSVGGPSLCCFPVLCRVCKDELDECFNFPASRFRFPAKPVLDCSKPYPDSVRETSSAGMVSQHAPDVFREAPSCLASVGLDELPRLTPSCRFTTLPGGTSLNKALQNRLLSLFYPWRKEHMHHHCIKHEAILAQKLLLSGWGLWNALCLDNNLRDTPSPFNTST